MTDNITMKRDGTTLTITIDLAKTYGPSSTGKTTIIASSEGNVSIPGNADMKLGLNLYTKRAG